MKHKSALVPTLGLLVALYTSSNAAFIVEAHSSGLGNGNFSYGGDTTSASASIPSNAVGLTGTNSLFGGNGSSSPDTYVFSYTPGTDADNFSPAPGTLLGSNSGFGTETASGILGGGTTQYNIYWTTIAATNSNAAGIRFTITSDGADIVLDPVNGNNGGTGADLDPGGAFVGGAVNSWYLLGTVDLTAGSTYTVTQEANVNSFVSMRSHAIMWEAVPEPSVTSAILLAGLFGATRRRR